MAEKDDVKGPVREFKRRAIVRALRDGGGNQAQAARTLGLSRGYVNHLVKQYEIEREEWEPGSQSG
jgi:transcriptional regulator with GAF, ATPase, and Fis domain